MITNILSIVAIVFSVPSLILSIVELIRNRYRLDGDYQIYRHTDLYKDGNKTPSDYCRAFGTLTYVNYSNLNFYIVKITVVFNKTEYLLEQRNPDNREVIHIIEPYTPFEIPVAPRVCGKENFSVQIPKGLKYKTLKIRIYTSYRKRPFKGKVKSYSKEQTNNSANSAQ